MTFRWPFAAALVLVLGATPVLGQSYEHTIAKAVQQSNTQWIPARLDNDMVEDILIFQPQNGCFFKWYSSSATTGKWESQQPMRCIGGAPNTVNNAKLLATDFNNDGMTDFLVITSDGRTVYKWYSMAARGPDFIYHKSCTIGGACPGT